MVCCVNALLQASAFPHKERSQHEKQKHCVNALLQASAFPHLRKAKKLKVLC